MSLARKKLGDWGESVAATFLESAGYAIVARNWRCSLGEIDLVAQKGIQLAFVEVKTRRSRTAGSPEEAITPRKAQKLRDLCGQYLADHQLDDVLVSIDLIAIECERNGVVKRIEHLPEFVTGW